MEKKNFIIANDGTVEKIIIFGTQEGLMTVARSDNLFMDGTFYSSPNIFCQLYTIHVSISG